MTVTATVDGDTFRAVVDGRDQRIRILGINAPEVAHGDQAQQCGGEAARTALDRMIWHKTVTLFTGPGSDMTDQYGRPLRYVELGGVDIGLAMIQQGRASEYHPRSAAAESRTAEYVAAQQVAMREHRGQWATTRLLVRQALHQQRVLKTNHQVKDFRMSFCRRRTQRVNVMTRRLRCTSRSPTRARGKW